MQYSILIYGAEGIHERLPPEEQETIMQAHRDLQKELAAKGGYATAKLMPVSNAVTIKPTVRKDAKPLITDGPFAETKERLLGFYVTECETLEEAIALANKLATPHVSLEVRPVAWAGGSLVDS